MRTLQKNKIKMKYALLIGEQDEIALDDDGNPIINYIDDDGNVYYQYTGEKELIYSEPTEFSANFSMSGGESEAVSFGIDISAYDAVITTVKNTLPISETSLIWVENEVVYKDIDKTKIMANSADYKVTKVSNTLNVTMYVLKAMVK